MYKPPLLYGPPCIIAGQLTKDSEVSAEIPANIEVGLLGNLRKLLMLLPDSTVRRVVGQVLQHETLIAIAHNPSIIIRTAVIRVSPAYALLILPT